MKTLTVTLLSLAALLGSIPSFQSVVAAQAPLGRLIAYDYCQMYDWEQGVVCGVFLANGAHLGDGTDPAWSPDGSKIAFVGYSEGGIDLVNLSDWSLVHIAVYGGSPTWSPDSRKLAVSLDEIYVIDSDESNVTQLTQNVGFRGRPAWSPDGSQIAFDCEIEPGNLDICAVHADGTGLVRLTTRPASDSGPAYSPDGLKIAFDGVAIMNADGTGLTQMGPGGIQPAWSPDGTRIAYVVSFEGGACQADGRICPDSIYTINVDGTDPRFLADGNRPTWGRVSTQPVAFPNWPTCNGLACTFDGSTSWGGDGGIVSYAWDFGDGTTGIGSPIQHTYAAIGTYQGRLTVTDGAGVTATRSFTNYVHGNVWPTASFTFACDGLRCTFDGSGSQDSDGSVTTYTWNFGDGAPPTHGSASSVTHIYPAPGTFTVRLIVMDNNSARGEHQQTVTVNPVVNTPPVALFTAACSQLTCSFNAQGSSDADGTIVSYSWTFGNGLTGSGATLSRTYLAGGTYSVTLTVMDNQGATSAQSQSVTAIPPEMHIGDLDRASTNQQSTWTATVAVTLHDEAHAPLGDAFVSGSWSDGSLGSCTIVANGRCSVTRSGIRKATTSISFTVTNVARTPHVYKPASNHDPDGDSNGTTISVNR